MNHLEQIEEFSTSTEIAVDLKKYGTIMSYKEGEILIHEHRSIQRIPIILSGSVKVYQTDDDIREMLLYYLKEGETCIMSFLGGLYNESSKIKAVANEDSEILFIPVQKLGILTKKHPEWVNYIFRVYHQRFQELLDVVNAVAFKKMDERLLQFLTKKAEITGNKSIIITHVELANELGTARVVISRLLKQMEQENLVKLERNKIILL